MLLLFNSYSGWEEKWSGKGLTQTELSSIDFNFISLLTIKLRNTLGGYEEIRTED
jgi:hypothetical protein